MRASRGGETSRNEHDHRPAGLEVCGPFSVAFFPSGSLPPLMSKEEANRQVIIHHHKKEKVKAFRKHIQLHKNMGYLSLSWPDGAYANARKTARLKDPDYLWSIYLVARENIERHVALKVALS